MEETFIVQQVSIREKALFMEWKRFDWNILERNILKAVTFDLAVSDGCHQNEQTQHEECSIAPAQNQQEYRKHTDTWRR
jgi:hypothetical protein